MKGIKYYIIMGFIITMFVILRTFRLNDSSNDIRTPHYKATESTEEDPYARARYRWMLLHDPKTGEIPRHIRTKESTFLQKLSKSNAKHGPVTSHWTFRGPCYVGGRTKALALDCRDENTILAGGVSAGMWKSTDGGRSWRKTTRPDQLHSVSCIAQNRSSGKEDIWYYGTGEWFPSGRGGSASVPIGGTNIHYRGDGIFKSVDGGESWSLLPSTVSGTADMTDPFDFIYRLATFGQNGVFAATSSGLFKSDDRGTSWQHDLNFGENYPSTEIALTSKEICYATIGGKGPDNGIYKSPDKETWQNISPPDWPDTTVRTVISILPSNEKIIYFYTCVNHLQTQLRKYEDGVGWTDLTDQLPNKGELTTYGGNMLIFYVKPDDENTFFLGTVGLYRSMDGGQSWEVIGAYGAFHVDQHAIVFPPSDPKSMIVGNDGGLFKTRDNTAAVQRDPKTHEYRIEWESLNNGYITTQFYTVAVDQATPGCKIISGGMQDNGCMFTDSEDFKTPWTDLLWGDGGFTAIEHGGRYQYTSLGATFWIMRHSFQDGVHQWTEVTPTQTRGGSVWLPPFILDPHDTRIMYLPWRRQLWRNSDLTQIQHVFPPKPTDFNWTQLENVQDYYISALGMSGAKPRRLYYGSIYGRLLRLDNPHQGQPVPVDITSDNFPLYGYFHCIAVDPRNANKLLVVFPNYGVISIFASEDGGDTWTPVSGNLEETYYGTGCGPSVRWVDILYVQDRPVYFAGTSVGLFSATGLNGEKTVWVHEAPETIGNMVIDMITVRQSDGLVVVGTHGGGVYSTHVTELPSSVAERVTQPRDFELLPPYPNPFNQSTTVRFRLPGPGKVELSVYNVRGESVEKLVAAHASGGEHRMQWRARGLASGIYFLHLKWDRFTQVRKVLYQK